MTIEAPPLWVQGGTYPARLDRFIIASMYDEGARTPTGCKASQRGAGANFSVDLAIGEFIITGDDQALQGNYLGRITAIENAVIGAAPAGSNKRIDLVTLRVNDPNAGGNAGNTVSVVVVAGTQTTGTPVAPALPASSIPICTVGPITSATASITNSIITDVRTIAGPKAPVGEMRLFGPSVSVNGWLACNGQAVSRATYADLFAYCGTTFGAGDGSTTFNLPDLRDRVPVSSGSTFSALGAVGGEVTHVLTPGELASHDHGSFTGFDTPSHTHSGSTSSDGAHPHNLDTNAGTGATYKDTATSATFGAGLNVPVRTTGSFSDSTVVHALADSASNHAHAFATGGPSTGHQHSIAANGSNTAHNNMQPYQVVAGWLIRS